MVSWYLGTIIPWNQRIMHAIKGACDNSLVFLIESHGYDGTFVSWWYHDIMVLGHQGTMMPWFLDGMVLWYHDIVVSWHYGTVVPTIQRSVGKKTNDTFDHSVFFSRVWRQNIGDELIFFCFRAGKPTTGPPRYRS